MERTCNIDEILIGDRCRKDMGDIRALADSIDRIGLLQPPVVNTFNRLIAGHRRIEALRLLNRKQVTVWIAETPDEVQQLLEAERDENTCRKDFTPSEAVEIGQRIEEAYQPPSPQETGSKGGKSAGKGRPKSVRDGATCPTPKRDESKRTTAVAAESAGMSRRTYEKAKQVVEAAESEPEKYGDLKDEMDRTGKVDGAHKKLKQSRKPKPAPKYPVSDEFNRMIVGGLIEFFDGFMAQYDRSVAALVASSEWDREYTRIAANHLSEAAKAFSRMAKEMKSHG
jgi:hypothetical protein